MPADNDTERAVFDARHIKNGSLKTSAMKVSASAPVSSGRLRLPRFNRYLTITL
jgi:hypothetical protein